MPLPGSKTAVAYFNLENHNRHAITINAITSPQFNLVEFHETTYSDGIARMQEMRLIEVAAESVIRLEPGGKHLMLMQPNAELGIGSPITLQINYDQEGLVVITATMRSRNAQQ